MGHRATRNIGASVFIFLTVQALIGALLVALVGPR
jgi:hypothetical protein